MFPFKRKEPKCLWKFGSHKFPKCKHRIGCSATQCWEAFLFYFMQSWQWTTNLKRHWQETLMHVASLTSSARALSYCLTLCKWDVWFMLSGPFKGNQGCYSISHIRIFFCCYLLAKNNLAIKKAWNSVEWFRGVIEMFMDISVSTCRTKLLSQSM